MLYSVIKRFTSAEEELLHRSHEEAVQAALSFLPLLSHWLSLLLVSLT